MGPTRMKSCSPPPLKQLVKPQRNNAFISPRPSLPSPPLLYTMSSVLQSFHNRSFMPNRTLHDALPVSQINGAEDRPLRRRLSSLSLKLQPLSSPATSWVLRRSKSVSSMGESAGNSVKTWWDWGCSWILSRKPVFAKDLEMNEEESKAIGSHSRGSWRHVFYKVRSEIRKMMGSEHLALPQSYKYDSFN